MAGGVVRSLITRILFKSDASGLKKVETHTRAAKREMRAASRAAYTLKRDLKGMALGFRHVVGALIAGRVAKLFTHDFAKAADEAAKFARGLGISTEAYQAMTHAAGLSGITIQELNVALPKLAQNAGNAADGSKAAADAFRRAGVDIKTAGGKFKDPIRLMTEIADSFKEGRIQGNRTQVLMNLFGRSGKKMGVLLEGGSKGIKAAMLEAKKLGVVLSVSEAKIAEDYNDEMLRTVSVLKGVRNQIAVKLLPAVTKNLHAFVAWAKSGDNLRRALHLAGVAAKFLAVALAAIVTVKLAQTFTTLVGVLKKTAFWMRINGIAALKTAAKYMLIVAAVAAVVLVIQSLYVWSKGGKSAVGDLFEHFGVADKARAVVNALGAAVKWLGTVGYSVAKIVWKLIVLQHQMYKALWREFGPALIALGYAIRDLFNELWPVILDGFEVFKTALTSGVIVLGQVWRAIKPGLLELQAALIEIWIAVKPGLTALWLAWLKIQEVLWSLIKKALPYLGTVAKGSLQVLVVMIVASINALTLLIKMVTWLVKAMKWAAGQIAKAWNAALGPIKKLVDGIASKVGWVVDKAASLTGAKVGITGMAELAAGRRRQLAPGGATTNQISVGAVSVSVQGTADMTPAQFEAAVAAGTKRALDKTVSDTFSIFRPTIGVPVTA